MPDADIPQRTVRPVTAAEFEQTLSLGLEAFGDLPEGMARPTAEGFPGPGRHSWGAFEGDRLLGRMVGREFGSWWHGVEVPTCGIAGVTVAAEERGRGLLDELFPPLFAEARDRGEVVSTLYPTAPGVYRRYGYELVAALETVELRTAELMGVRPPVGVRVRRATLEDVPAIKGVYDAWAAEQNGPLTRRGVSFTATDEEFLGGPTAVSVAVDGDDRVVGFVSWTRGRGYGDEGRLTIDDLVALTPDAHRALWRMVATYAPVTPTVRLTTSGTDPARLVLPAVTWRVVEKDAYMLRLLDVAVAFSLLPARPVRGEVELVVAGDRFGGTDGRYRVTAADDGVTCERLGDDGRDAGRGDGRGDGTPATFTPAGLALAWAGAQTAGNLRMSGMLTGGSPAGDAFLDVLLRGNPLHVRDYF